jgi:hypothetical protein
MSPAEGSSSAHSALDNEAIRLGAVVLEAPLGYESDDVIAGVVSTLVRPTNASGGHSVHLVPSHCIVCAAPTSYAPKRSSAAHAAHSTADATLGMRYMMQYPLLAVTPWLHCVQTACCDPPPNIIVVSADKDMQQLLARNVAWLQPLPCATRRLPCPFELHTADTFLGAFRFPAASFSNYLALVGKADSSVGGTGISDKTARKLLQRCRWTYTAAAVKPCISPALLGRFHMQCQCATGKDVVCWGQCQLTRPGCSSSAPFSSLASPVVHQMGWTPGLLAMLCAWHAPQSFGGLQLCCGSQ